MLRTIDIVGLIGAGVWFLAIVVLAVISKVKGRHRGKVGGNEAGGSYVMSEGSTPGYWDAGSLGGDRGSPGGP